MTPVAAFPEGLVVRVNDRPGLSRVRLLSAASALLLLSLMLYAGALFAADRILPVQKGARPADIIVVLGGNGPRRARGAAELYRKGLAAKILVTGRGDCLLIRGWLMERQVPADAILVECESGTTWENATFSSHILRENGVRRALLVTDWFHMRRALGCFRMVDPAIEWQPMAIAPPPHVMRLAGTADGNAAVKEYAKIAWYFLRYGVSPVDPGEAAVSVRPNPGAGPR